MATVWCSPPRWASTTLTTVIDHALLASQELQDLRTLAQQLEALGSPPYTLCALVRRRVHSRQLSANCYTPVQATGRQRSQYPAL